MKPTLVMAAVPRELEILSHSLEGGCTGGQGVFPTIEGFLGETRLICCAGGVGKANAAAAAAALLERHRPGLVIVTGCGGAYPGSGLAVGDLAVASDELFADEGVATPSGWLDLKAMGLPLVTRRGRQYFNRIPLSRHGAEKAMQLAANHGVRLARGSFLTVSTCSGALSRGLELAQRYQAICENMEGAAVALVALRYGIPCLEIRGISNLVEDRDLARWDLPRAMETAQRFVLKIVEDLQRPSPRVDGSTPAVPEEPDHDPA